MPDTEADEPSEIGPADPFPLGEYSKGDVFALGEGRVEPARPEQELDQSLARPRAAFRRGKVEFAPDSALEEAVSSEPVSEAEFPASWENTGNFVDSGLGHPNFPSKVGILSMTYRQIPYATEQGTNCAVAGNQIGSSGKLLARSGNPSAARAARGLHCRGLGALSGEPTHFAGLRHGGGAFVPPSINGEYRRTARPRWGDSHPRSSVGGPATLASAAAGAPAPQRVLLRRRLDERHLRASAIITEGLG